MSISDITDNTATKPCICGAPSELHNYGDPGCDAYSSTDNLSPLGNPLHPCPGCGTPIAILDGGGVIYTVPTIDTYNDIDVMFCSPCGEVLR